MMLGLLNGFFGGSARRRQSENHRRLDEWQARGSAALNAWEPLYKPREAKCEYCGRRGAQSTRSCASCGAPVEEATVNFADNVSSDPLSALLRQQRGLALYGGETSGAGFWYRAM